MGCSVMSVSHSRFGPVAVKSRSTRSSCTGGPGFLDRPRLRVCGDDPGLRAHLPHPPFNRSTGTPYRSSSRLISGCSASTFKTASSALRWWRWGESLLANALNNDLEG